MGSVLGSIAQTLMGGEANENVGEISYGQLADDTAKQRRLAEEAQKRQGAKGDFTEANVDLATERGAMGRMGQAADLAQQAALGQGPSAAQQLLQRGSDQAIAAQAAAAAGASGNAASQIAAQRAAMGQMANIQGNTATDLAALRAKEQQAGMELYAQQTGAMANAAAQARGMGLQQAGMNLEAEMKQRALNDAQTQAAYQLQHQQKLAQLQADTERQKMITNLRNANAQREQEGGETLFSGALGAAAAALMAPSDTTLKKEKLLQEHGIEPHKKSEAEFLDYLKEQSGLPKNMSSSQMKDWMDEQSQQEMLTEKLQRDQEAKPSNYTWDQFYKEQAAKEAQANQPAQPVQYVQAPQQVIPSAPGVEQKPWESDDQYRSRLYKDNPAAYQGLLQQGGQPQDPNLAGKMMMGFAKGASRNRNVNQWLNDMDKQYVQSQPMQQRGVPVR